jgi:hypothetical protein
MIRLCRLRTSEHLNISFQSSKMNCQLTVRLPLLKHEVFFAVSTQIFAPNRDGWNIMYQKKCTQKSLYMKINGCAKLQSSFNAIRRPMLYGSAVSTRPPPSHLHPAHAALSRAGFETQRLQKSSAASFPPARLPRTRAALASRRPNPPRAAAPRAALVARQPNPPVMPLTLNPWQSSK